MLDIKKRIFIILLGIILVGIGYHLTKQNDTIKDRCTEKTTGRVAEVSEEKKKNGDVLYYPIIEYTVNGMTHKQRTKTSENPLIHSVGQYVEINYNPKNVTEIRIATESNSRVIAIVFIIIGGMLVLIGLVSRGIK